METERAYLVEIGGEWINLSRIEHIGRVLTHLEKPAARIVTASGHETWVSPEVRQQILDKLASFGLLAS